MVLGQDDAELFRRRAQTGHGQAVADAGTVATVDSGFDVATAASDHAEGDAASGHRRPQHPSACGRRHSAAKTPECCVCTLHARLLP